MAQAARALRVNPEMLRNWVKQAKIDWGLGPMGALTTAERQEFTRLRRLAWSASRNGGPGPTGKWGHTARNPPGLP